MSEQLITINNQELDIKEYRGIRVVTFKDVDILHKRAEGTAKRNFIENKKHFVKDEDYFILTKSQKNEFHTFEIPNRGLTLLSESGYLLLVKSLTDDLAWEVQKELINKYFRAKEILKAVPIKTVELKSQEIEARLRNARAKEAGVLLKIANNPELPKEYVLILHSKASEIINGGKALIPLPKSDRKTYSATEIGELLGVSSAKVGSLTNKYNLKTDEFGLWVWDKSRHSSKEVRTFRYYDNIIPELEKYLL